MSILIPHGIHMGGGAGPAGQVLAGPLFCLVNEQILFII